jgi:hypothetical protein
LDQQQSNRSAPKHADRHPRFELRQTRDVNRDAERFEHRAVFIAQRIGQWKETIVVPSNVFAQCAIFRIVSRKALRRTQIWFALTTILAHATRDQRIDGNALPRAFGDTSKFVTQNKRAIQFRVADARFAEPVQIGTANADRRYTDE